ncbi:MAG: hypothetical protein JSU77_03670 [Fidelibacterota bacterium]|nr:MAG: hypothetical protein JSU77_03670 [Candidatus Neomarinimicrobiota bacterium]
MNQLRDPNGPVHYQIKLQGQLREQWSDWFSGMTVTICKGMTLLTGPVIDQSALHGILTRVRDLGLPLISINRIEPGNGRKPIQQNYKES